jgi:hypothetical protein
MACKHTNLKNTLGYEQGAIGVVCLCVLKAFQQYQESGLGGIMETQIFHHTSSSKKSSKGNQNPSKYYNSI